MIYGEQIFLRPLRIEDWEVTFTWRNDLKFNNSILSHSFPVTEELEKAWIQEVVENRNNNELIFGICEKNSDKLIGITKIYNINWISRNSNFGIYIYSTKDRGRGFGKEVTELLIKYAFDVLNLRKIKLEVLEKNKTAIKLYQSLNFVTEGKLDEERYLDSKYENVMLMALFRKKH